MDLLVGDVLELQDVHVSHGDRSRERLPRPAIPKDDLPVMIIARIQPMLRTDLAKLIQDLVFLRTVEDRRCHQLTLELSQPAKVGLEDLP